MSRVDDTSVRLSMYMGGQVLTKVLYMAGIVLATRALGVEGWGLFTACLSAGLIAVTFVNLGLNPYVTREVASGRRSLERLFAAAGRYRMVTSLLFLLALPPLLAVTVPGTTWPLVLAVALYLVADSWAKYFFAQLRGAENTRFEVLGGIVEKLAVFGAAAAALLLFPPSSALGVVAGGFVLAAGLKLAVAGHGGRREFAVPILPGRLLRRGLLRTTTWMREATYLRASAPFLFMALFSTIYFRVDSYMLAAMIGNEAAGNYGAAYKLLEGLMFAPGAVLAVYNPMLVHTLEGKLEEKGVTQSSATVLGKVAALQTTIVGLIGLGMFLEHEWLILTLYGDSFAAAVPLLFWLAPAFVAIGFNFLFGGLLTAAYRQDMLLKITGVGAAANIAVNLVAIPRYGALGATVATVLTETGTAVAMAFVARRELPLAWLLRPAARVVGILAVIVAAPVLLFAETLPAYLRICLELALALLSGAVLLHLEMIPNPLRTLAEEASG